MTLTTFDDEGRVTETIQNYSTTIAAANNITTDYQFNGGTALLSVTTVTTEKADLSGVQKQITAYVYGTATDDTSAAVYRDDLVCAVISGLTPSENLTGLVSDIEDGDISGLNVVEYQFDRQGETIQMIDQNGTQHDYTLDNLGRQVSDTATVLGAGVYDGAGAVRRIDTAYDLLGDVSLTTSFSSTTADPDDIVNQVADTYNGFCLLTEEQQSVSGAVDASTPAVQYSYSTSAATPTRLVGVTYPNGRVLTYAYDTGADSAVGRVSYLADSDGTQLADYSYLGLDEIDEVSSPQPAVTLDLGHKNADGDLDRVDQFNRATDMVFAEIGAGNVDEIMQGYDVSGNELWQAQPTAASYGVHLDELYGYNPLNELTGATRGTLNSTDTAITANQNLTETWSLDGMGNWSNYTQTGGATSIDQDRDTNSLNQITDYNSTSTWAVPGYLWSCQHAGPRFWVLFVGVRARGWDGAVFRIVRWRLDGAVARWLPPRDQAGFPTSRIGNSGTRCVRCSRKTIGDPQAGTPRVSACVAGMPRGPGRPGVGREQSPTVSIPPPCPPRGVMCESQFLP